MSSLEEAVRQVLGDSAKHFEIQIYQDTLAARVFVLLLNKEHDFGVEVGIDMEQMEQAISDEIPAHVQCQVTRVRGLSKEAAQDVEVARLLDKCMHGWELEIQAHVLKQMMKDKVQGLALLSVHMLDGDQGAIEYLEGLGLVRRRTKT